MSLGQQRDRSVQSTSVNDWTRTPAAIAATILLAVLSVGGIAWSVNRTLQNDRSLATAPIDQQSQQDQQIQDDGLESAAVDSVRDESTNTLSAVRLIDLNTASAGELEMLPSIGPATASKIIADREEHGNYETIEDLQRVSGIGPKTIEKIRSLTRVSQ